MASNHEAEVMKSERNDSAKPKEETKTSNSLPSQPRSLDLPIVPSSDDPSAISLLSRDCVKQFHYICDILKDLELRDPEISNYEGKILGYDTHLALLTMQDARARFKAWGDGIAAFHDGHVRISLDSRLREAPDFRRRALQILEYMQEYLHEATLIITGEKPNDLLDSHSTSGLSEGSGEEDDEKGAKEAGGHQRSKSENGHAAETTELQEIFTAIIASNKSLMKLSMVIRSSPARDDYIKAASRYQDWNPYADIGHVREKHGSAKGSTDWLLIRLGNAIARRRQFLKYRVEHSARMAGGWEEGEKLTKEDEKTIASTKATTFMAADNVYQREGSNTPASFGSQTSYEQTVLGDETAATILTVPPPPKFAFPDVQFEYGEPFNCPYCYTEQNVRNKAAWKKHVFRDLKPYICTFKECSMMMFRSRNEWFAHELQKHRREWACQYCQYVPFPTSASFSNHILSSHPAVLASTQIEAILLQSEEAVDTISAFACPLCDEWEETVMLRQEKQEEKIRVLNGGEMVEPYGTRKQFRRHLGRHMEQLALFALPKNDAELEDDSTEGEEDGDSDHESPQEFFGPNTSYVSHFDMFGRKGLELHYKSSQDPYDAAALFFAKHKLPVTQEAMDEVAAWITQRLQAYGGTQSAIDPISADVAGTFMSPKRAERAKSSSTISSISSNGSSGSYDELETAKVTVGVQQQDEGEAISSENLEEGIAQNVAWFKEAQQSTASPAGAAIAELEAARGAFGSDEKVEKVEMEEKGHPTADLEAGYEENAKVRAIALQQRPTRPQIPLFPQTLNMAMQDMDLFDEFTAFEDRASARNASLHSEFPTPAAPYDKGPQINHPSSSSMRDQEGKTVISTEGHNENLPEPWIICDVCEKRCDVYHRCIDCSQAYDNSFDLCPSCFEKVGASCPREAAHRFGVLRGYNSKYTIPRIRKGNTNDGKLKAQKLWNAGIGGLKAMGEEAEDGETLKQMTYREKGKNLAAAADTMPQQTANLVVGVNEERKVRREMLKEEKELAKHLLRTRKQPEEDPTVVGEAAVVASLEKVKEKTSEDHKVFREHFNIPFQVLEKGAEEEIDSTASGDTKINDRQASKGSGVVTGVRCPTCAVNGKEVWSYPGRQCMYCGTAVLA